MFMALLKEGSKGGHHFGAVQANVLNCNNPEGMEEQEGSTI